MYGVNESNSEKEYETIKKEITQELKKEFRPEFINRIDEIIVFHKIEDDDMRKIIDLMLEKLVNRLKKQGYLIKIDESIREYIMKQQRDKNYGARPLRREIQNIVEDSITDNILNGTIIPDEQKIMIEAEGKILFK